MRAAALSRASLHGWRELNRDRSEPPDRAGVYAWYFASIPPRVPVQGTARRGRYRLLYVGIAPSRQSSAGSLRNRIQMHFGGNAEGSTLRMTLGCLLQARLRLELRRGGARGRY